MKLLILSFVVALVAAAPAPPTNNQKENADILSYYSETGEHGYYKFGFVQSDGTKHEQEGELRNEGTDDAYYFVKGSYSWVGPDGVTYTVRYEAGEDGYNPDIEQGPGGSIPPNIAASLLG